jgi:hypothetical protein
MNYRSAREPTGFNEAGRLYATAYAAHYAAKDLRGAFELYRSLMATHPDTPEAGYSQSQILNIANAVVPKQKILDAQVELALAYLESGD